VVTRFPPEPNGYLHIGHAKSIALNFGIAQEFRWPLPSALRRHQSDERGARIYRRHRARRALARLRLGNTSLPCVRLLRTTLPVGRAPDPHRQGLCRRPVAGGDAHRPRHPDRAGTQQSWRDRTIEENLDLFRRMRAGEFPNGARVLRAKIDMAPATSICAIRCSIAFYTRAIRAPAQPGAFIPAMTSPMANRMPSSTSPTRSARSNLRTTGPCTTGSSNTCRFHPPAAVRVRRLNLTHTVLSKRVLTELVRGGHVRGWDDPRMPTLAGCAGAACRRRRCAISSSDRGCQGQQRGRCGHVRLFGPRSSQQGGVATHGGAAPPEDRYRKLPEGRSEEIEAVNHPDDPAAGTRRLRFGRELYVERDDFMEHPPKKFYRLSPGREVRLRYAYFITCREVVKNPAGEVVELRWQL